MASEYNHILAIVKTFVPCIIFLIIQINEYIMTHQPIPNVFIYSFRVDDSRAGIQFLPIKESLINSFYWLKKVWLTIQRPTHMLTSGIGVAGRLTHSLSGKQHLPQPPNRPVLSINRERPATRCLGNVGNATVTGAWDDVTSIISAVGNYLNRNPFLYAFKPVKYLLYLCINFFRVSQLS